MVFCGIMMTSSNGNIFRVTGPLCGEFTGPGEFPTQRPVTWSFDVFFDLRLNKWLSKQPWGWWFETPSWSLWRHRNDVITHPCPNSNDSLAKPPLLKTLGHKWVITSHCFTYTYWNLLISQILLSIRQISHNTAFCNRNVHMHAHFSYKMLQCGVRDWCIVGFVQQIYWSTL